MRARLLTLMCCALLSCREQHASPPAANVSSEAAPDGRAAAGNAAHGGDADGVRGGERFAVPLALERDGRVASEPARSGRVAGSVSAPCEVVAPPDAQSAVAATVSARIVRWHVGVGDVIRAGAPVVTLDSRDVAEQRNALARARIDAGDAAGRVGEEDRMLPQGATSPRAVREARASLARARSQIDAARRALAIAQAPEAGPAGVFTLRSAAGGTVLGRDGAVGAVVEPGARLLSVVDLERVRIAAHLPEEAADVAEGARAVVSLRGVTGTVGARVAWREPALDARTRTRTVLLEPDERAQLLLQQSGTASVERGAAGEAVTVPASAVYREGPRAWVFLREGPGAYRARAVTLGHDDGATVEVVAGLRAGETVVVRGTFLVATEHIRAGEGATP